uniref:Alpha/beta hydrolase fold-3 domain-containing protein n=1 Tax=Lotharella oceanica TaxID=641309 RepID=A0A7S2X9D8_9EUKA|mmetsp:Transcript_2201/g.4203  ORF Transcript_2201/g.4203 Transcript_2201/m.4203 type:complete len:116 (+) Transcript_2201:148-495(+)|eukprot:CAMPEP_0170188114 /NCGR_PEP_ID=MMETSP0040_2-20121228/43503_1 /TAXON_ID=641309 /ORGANISM="Lotharella oceanica, Strain CCMP622" /LENGTH=115 /DNA_ID=CAMNT_0010435313 /DNA_START=136 /DNA_END=483 /DNA_ORIENTATION=+
MSGGMDLLLDDAVDFHIRLRRSGVPGRFKIFRTLPHGFFGLDQLLPEAHEATKVAVSWIQSALFRMRTSPTREQQHPFSPSSEDASGANIGNSGSSGHKVSFEGDSKEASKEEGG